MSFPKGHILCADDNDDSRELVRVMLETIGYNIKCVESAFEALDLLSRKPWTTMGTAPCWAN
jgi:CheY-like chemotaxis protein